MKNIICLTVIAWIVSLGVALGQTQPTPNPAYRTMGPLSRYLMASPAEEIAAARTAAPPSVSAKATILVLGKHGYYEAVHGTNGWVCWVERSWMAGLDDPELWNYHGRAPNCFNPPAVRSVLPQYLARTTWAIAGATRAQIAAKAKAAYASHRFVDPAPASFSYMLSKHAFLNDEVAGPWHPHVMPFIAMRDAATWSAGFDGTPILLGPYMTPYEPMTIFIPVRRWSDGTFDLPPTPSPSPSP